MDGNIHTFFSVPDGMLTGLPIAALFAVLAFGSVFGLVVLCMGGSSPPMTKRWRK